MQDRQNEPDIFEDICKMVTGKTILSELRRYKEEVKRILQIMPLDKYPEEQVERFRRYVFEEDKTTRKAGEKQKEIRKKFLAGFGIFSDHE